MSRIAQNLMKISQRIEKAAKVAGRDSSTVNILAVSKTHSMDKIREAYAAGLTRFGESYVQEAIPKIKALASLPLEWHFIGPIQSNKTRDIAEHFDWVQSVDRLKIASRLNEQRPKELKPLNICVQINISMEDSKSGIVQQALHEFAAQLKPLRRLKLRGLMAIPQKTADEHQQRAFFAALRRLFDDLNQEGYQLDTLSMGMTNDLEAAVIEGSTLLRIGSGLFGARSDH
ncbi:MAG: YggS family pyridoxal phosphate-dependent enzyme [Gammaproteobacteria bacterium]|nr:YggS family pyridoxal phosphate-dependent enzyme [Gammaproteobacteria bacterium]